MGRQQIIPPPGLTAEQVAALLPIEQVRSTLASRTDVGATADDVLKFAAEAGATYFIDGALLTTWAAGNTVPNQVQLIAPTGATGEISFMRIHSIDISSAQIVERAIAGVNTIVQNRNATDNATAKSQPNYYLVGYVTIGATAGDVAIGWGVNSGGASGTVYANVGSYLRAKKIS